MIALSIRHKTTYQYNRPIGLGPHRLMLRPRESRELRLVSSDVTVTPHAVVSWAHDVFGNAVATATFQAAADQFLVACSFQGLQDLVTHAAQDGPVGAKLVGICRYIGSSLNFFLSRKGGQVHTLGAAWQLRQM